MSKKTKKLILLDAHAIIHRAYHALPDFSNSKGEPTGALYGIIAMILKIAQDLKPDYIVACYDLPGKTFRHEAYDDYKGGRKEIDNELVAQLKSSRGIMEAFNIPIYDYAGFEADDMLGTIVDQLAKNKELDIVIASGDMDTLQLVDDKKVQVYTLRKGINDTVVYDQEKVIERFGFEPELLPDYKGLRGDPSDNIPGVPGIGEKTATQLISEFGSLDALYTTLNKKDGEKKLLDAGIKQRIINLLKEHEEGAEFSKTLAVIRRDAPITFVLPDKNWQEGLDFVHIEELMGKYEFRTLWGRIKKMFGIENRDGTDGIQQEKPPSDDEVYKIGIAVWLLNSEITNPKLDDILQYSGSNTFTDAKQKILAELQEKKLDKVYEEIEIPIIPIVKQMEEWGILLDIKYLKNLSKKYHTELEKLEKKIYTSAGVEFNIKSPKQLSEILFDKMQLPTKGLKKTAGGARSTRESELEKLRGEHEIIEAILSYRELQKLLSTYIDNLPKMVADDGRLHARFLQAGTTTGRFSSQDPNLQNIPIKSELGKKIRNGFVASSQHKLAAFDYSQIELRCAAILSKDPTLTEIFQAGKDVHSAVAARVFGVSEEDVTYEMRRRAKVINFGIIYGMGVNALQKNLNSTRAEAQEFYNQYFERFPAIRKYLDDTKTFALKHGYTETLLGRRRYFPALQSHLPFIRAAAERMAINAPIQGTATADIIKIAIRQVYEQLKEKKIADKVHLLLQIHDELMFEIHEDVLTEAVPMIKEIMETALQNSYIKYESPVPLVVNAEIGDSWGEMKPL